MVVLHELHRGGFHVARVRGEHLGDDRWVDLVEGALQALLLGVVRASSGSGALGALSRLDPSELCVCRTLPSLRVSASRGTSGVLATDKNSPV